MFALALGLLVAVQPCTSDKIAALKYSPPVSPIVAQSQTHGTVTMIVTLAAENGKPTNVRLSSSSGSEFLDQAALEQARFSRFSPEVRDCSSVGGQYFYSIEY